MALREAVIQRTVYVSDIDQQVCKSFHLSSMVLPQAYDILTYIILIFWVQVTEEQLDCLFIGFGQVYVSSTSSYLFVVCSLSWLVLVVYVVDCLITFQWKVMCFLDLRVSTSPVFGSQAEDEHEMRARTIYYTNIDTKVIL